MNRPIIAWCVIAFGGIGLSHASLPPKGLDKANGEAAAAAVKASAKTRIEAIALARAQDRALASFKRHQGKMAAREKKEDARGAQARANAARKAKDEAAALEKAFDRALASHKRYLSHKLAAEKLAGEKAASTAARIAKQAKKDAEALAGAQDRVVAYLRGKLGKGSSGLAAVHRIEKLACFTGIQDRHARIGVQLVDGKVDYFAYYSKWKPRTCSVAAERNGPYSYWEDSGQTSKVTLVDNKGFFTIDRKGGTVRFVFHDIDRMRYCGMSGKINGSLTVTRGKSKCVIDGVMDNHEG